MAIKPVTYDFTIGSADTFVIGDASNAFVGTYMVHFVSSSFVGTVVIKARARTIGSTAATPAFLEIPYLPLNTAGTVATYATGSSADITDTGIILIPASGLTIALDCTAFTSGALRCLVVPLAGAAA